MDLVVIESPFAGHSTWPWPFTGLGKWINRQQNIRYARRAMADSLARGEAPIASHLLYTQRGILRDDVYDERMRGIQAGFLWARCAKRRIFYVDRGMSPGMVLARREAAAIGQTIEFRAIDRPPIDINPRFA